MDLNRYEMGGKENWYALKNFPSPYISVELQETIDETAMRKAVAEAIVWHPLFGTRLIFENGLFYLEENPKPPIVFRADRAPKTYGGAESNDYPWIFTVEDNRLVFYSIHALSDGMGTFNFCKTVLHLYYRHLGVVFSDNVTDFPDGTPLQTMENAAKRYADPNNRMLGLPKFAPPAWIDPQYMQQDSGTPWELIIPGGEIRRFAKESETSVFAVIACILARAMAHAFHIETGNINVRVPVNLRAIFPSATDRNFVQGFPLCYRSERMNALPDAMVETAFRSQLDLYMEKSNLVQSLNEDVETVNRLKQGHDELQSILDWKPSPHAGANIIYTHITRLPFSEELMSRISGIQVASRLYSDKSVFVYGTTVRDEIYLTIQQCSKNDCYLQALREVLDARGITCKLTPFIPATEHVCRDTAVLREGGNKS